MSRGSLLRPRDRLIAHFRHLASFVPIPRFSPARISGLPMSSPAPSTTGSFTLPGEAGHEALTLRLARKWGADTIRDSDGTQLSPAITQSGYDIYSTLCLVRSVQPWAREHRDQLQQNFLMSFPVVAARARTTIPLLAGFYAEQFVINATDRPSRWWQVFDRTTGREVPKTRWSFNSRRGTVTISGATPGHTYTVNFLAFRIWEEISMYNHLTNNWGDREHLAAVDPMQPAVQKVLLDVPRPVAARASGHEGRAVHVDVLQLLVVLGSGSRAVARRVFGLG